ncbi:MAG TPA: hypothetical protein P5541_06370 [Thermovirgaceae bacterium]|nr:hypothetical protein [Thermovirgaceae bacterium]
MSSNIKHKWVFRPRFRRGAFGWRSQPAITRIKEAVSEIKKVASKNPILGGEGAVLFLEKVSGALENIDSSSGAIGSAVNWAIESLVPIVANAPADGALREGWLERLWSAVQADDMSYIESLADYWGELCATPECASRWADSFIETVRMVWGPGKELSGYYHGIPACLSSLFKAGRNDEIMDLLKQAPYKTWHQRIWGVKALFATGKRSEAIRFAEGSRESNQPDFRISEACEEILLASGMVEEAYERYALTANQKTTYLATFRAIAKKYSHKEPAVILKDLVARSPGNKGKWFAAAKSAGLYEEAISLANSSPCDPGTLARAARDMAETRPLFAKDAGIAALRWLAAGYGYEITSYDVVAAFDHTVKAAKKAGCLSETIEMIREMVSGEKPCDRLVSTILERELKLID